MWVFRKVPNIQVIEWVFWNRVKGHHQVVRASVFSFVSGVKMVALSQSHKDKWNYLLLKKARELSQRLHSKRLNHFFERAYRVHSKIEVAKIGFWVSQFKRCISRSKRYFSTWLLYYSLCGNFILYLFYVKLILGFLEMKNEPF